jgi:hypothetical protein
VAGTFFITIAPRLLVARDLIGGLYFPGRFFLRMLAALVLIAGALFWITRQADLFGRFDNIWLNIGLLLATGLAYLVVFLVSIRLLRLVRPDDIAEFKALGIPRLNRFLALFFGV